MAPAKLFKKLRRLRNNLSMANVAIGFPTTEKGAQKITMTVINHGDTASECVDDDVPVKIPPNLSNGSLTQTGGKRFKLRQ